MTEFFDLYTYDRRKTGNRVMRGEPIPHGEYHIVVQIMSVNNQGEVLLTQRVPQKTSGGRWECSGGCAITGETSKEAAVRELFEETGIRSYPSELSLEWTFTTDSMIRDFYIVHKNVGLDRLVLQDSEVCAAKWVTFDRLIEMSENDQTTYTVTKWVNTRRDELRGKIENIRAGSRKKSF